MEGKTVFTAKEAATYLEISPATIYRIEKQGLISPTRTPGSQRRFSRKSLERYLRKSQHFKPHQNPSKYKKGIFPIKETEAVYVVEYDKQVTAPETYQVNELFFQKGSI